MAIRAYRPGDEQMLYEVCLRTGAAGGDASGVYGDRRLLGEVFVGPYLALQPDLALVLDDGGGAEGYVLGALDTRAFELACERLWWPGLREARPLDRVAQDVPERWLAEWIHHPYPVPEAIVRDYPSHLHIDLLPRWQGAGWGRQLIDRLLAALTARGSSGVHLGVSTANTRAIGFYQRMGFAEVAQEGEDLYMGRLLGKAQEGDDRYAGAVRKKAQEGDDPRKGGILRKAP